MKKFLTALTVLLAAMLIFSAIAQEANFNVMFDGERVDGPLAALIAVAAAGGGILAAVVAALFAVVVAIVVCAGVSAVVIVALALAALVVALAVAPLLLPLLIVGALVWWLARRHRRANEPLEAKPAA